MALTRGDRHGHVVRLHRGTGTFKSTLLFSILVGVILLVIIVELQL